MRQPLFSHLLAEPAGRVGARRVFQLTRDNLLRDKLSMIVLLEMVLPVWAGQIPIEVVALGSVMLLIVVLIHGAGLDRIVARYKRRADVLRLKSWHPSLAMSVFAVTILLMLFLHISEIVVWGLVLKG